MNKLPILMSASVSTRGMKGACFSPDERERMYMDTLIFYANEIIHGDVERRIVFVENSGWDLARIRSSVADCLNQIEFISLPPEKFDISKGKGYNEILMISSAIEKSSFIKESNAFLKVTGRYPVYNIGHFIKKAERHIFQNGGFYYGDMKDHRIYDVLFPDNTAKWNGHAAYTVLFATTIDFYKNNLAPTYVECCDTVGDYVECVWYRHLVKYRSSRSLGVQLRFDREPVCGGLQGSDAQTFAFCKYNQSMKAWIWRAIGNGIRFFMPWFWF